MSNDITALMQKLKERAELAKRVGAKNPRFTADEVLALVEALEKAQHESAVNWEAAASMNVENQELKQRIAELENYAEAEAVGADKAAEDSVYWMKRCKELESRTVTVEIPLPDCTYADHSYPAYSKHQAVNILAAAGIQVIEGEGQ